MSPTRLRHAPAALVLLAALGAGLGAGSLTGWAARAGEDVSTLTATLRAEPATAAVGIDERGERRVGQHARAGLLVVLFTAAGLLAVHQGQVARTVTHAAVLGRRAPASGRDPPPRRTVLH